MTKVSEPRAGRNAQRPKAVVSELGRKLRRISEQIAASAEKPLSRRELEREIALRRGGIR